MKRQTGMTGWPSGNILDFRATYCRRSGVRIPVGKKKFVCVYLPSLPYKCFVAVAYIEFLCVLLIMISSIIIYNSPTPFNRRSINTVGKFHTKWTLQNSHSIWMHSVTKTIFPVFAFRVMHRVIMCSSICWNVQLATWQMVHLPTAHFSE